jgi:hypothetical protein
MRCCKYPASLLGILALTCAAAGSGAEPAAQADRASSAPAAVRPAEKPSKGQFLRVVRDAQGRAESLQTAIVRLAPQVAADRAIRVDLIAATHIADKSYYQQLNREFRKYDAVLYELVAPQGTRIPKGGRKTSDNPVSALQKGMKDLLALEFQLDQIDYTAKNMVHADMSPQQFAQSMRDRGESIWDVVGRMIAYAISRQNSGDDGATEAQLLFALFDKDRALILKRLLAEQFEDMEGVLIALEGPNGSTLLGQRNKTALAELRKQMAAGKREIAIFYGAAHMPDFQKRLAEDFGLRPVNVRWVSAWDLKGRAEGGGRKAEERSPGKF